MCLPLTPDHRLASKSGQPIWYSTSHLQISVFPACNADPNASSRSLTDLSDKSASSMLKDAKARRKFGKTRHPVEDGPACRIYGSMDVKKVTGNLHVVGLSICSLIQKLKSQGRRRLDTDILAGNIRITAVRDVEAADGARLTRHTPVMNLSHVIHEFSFGPFFPRISQPLDDSMELASARESYLTLATRQRLEYLLQLSKYSNTSSRLSRLLTLMLAGESWIQINTVSQTCLGRQSTVAECLASSSNTISSQCL